jgi:hypothetical protein
MVATAGTDIHGPTLDPHLGFNHIYANDLAEPDILSAIKQGHLYMSSGPRLELTARNAKLEYVMMGDVIVNDGVTLSLHWSNCKEGDVLGLIVNGGMMDEQLMTEQGMLEWLLPEHTHWCVIEVRDKHGEMRAVTNPIFMGRVTDWH